LNSEAREREERREERDALMDLLIHLLVYPLTFDHREGKRPENWSGETMAGELSYVHRYLHCLKLDENQMEIDKY
jgi:hypothetical protein